MHRHLIVSISFLIMTTMARAYDPFTQVPAIGVNMWERAGCVATADYQLLGSNGIRYFRTGFNEEEVDSIDDTVLRAAQSSVHILPILHTYVAPPTSAVQLASFEQFTRNMVKRYGPGGTFWFPGGVLRTDIPYLPIRAWEVWNEPNLSSNWGNQPTSPSAYATLLVRVKQAIRSVDGGAAILFGGLALRGADADTNGGITFLQQTLAQPGAATAFTAVSAHSYPTLPSDVQGHLATLRNTLTAAGITSEIWLTEFGWPTGGTTSTHPAVSLAIQDAYASETLTRVDSQRAALKLGPVFWFAFRDLTPGSANPCEAGFAATSWSNYLGLRTSQANGNNAKPAWSTLAQRAATASPLPLPLLPTATDPMWLQLK
jgi:hypothetical protein